MAERVRKSTRKAARGGAVCSTNRASAVYGHGAMTPRRSTITACWRQDGHGLAPEHHGRVVDAGLAHERASGVDLVMQQRCSASRCCLCGCCCCCSLARSCLTHITQHSSETQQRDSSDTQTATAVSETQRRGRSWCLLQCWPPPAACVVACGRYCAVAACMRTGSREAENTWRDTAAQA